LNVYLFVFAAFVLIIGPLSDRLGRKKVFLTALSLDIGGTLLCLMSSSSPFFLAGRALQAIGGCAGSVLSRVIAREHFSQEKSASVLAYLFIAVSAFIALSPIAGGIVEESFGWRVNFYILAAFQMLVLAGVYRFMPETLVKSIEKLGMQQVKQVITDPVFMQNSLLISTIWAGMYVFIGASAFFLIDSFGKSPSEYGFLFAVMIFGMILGSSVSTSMQKKLGVKRTEMICMSLIAAAGVLVTVFANVCSLFCISMTLYLFGTGVLLPLCQTRATQNGGKAIGLMFSVFIFMQMFLASSIGFVFSAFAPPEMMPYCVALIAFMSFAIYLSQTLRKASTV
jgi:DHA1 family bicyclomycin/chloramphenicol resistance-like MFS transporter